MRYPPSRDAVIKVNSYTHDEAGISTEKADMTVLMTEKRQRKALSLKRETDLLDCVKTYGKSDASAAILCWGSTLHVCREVAEKRGLLVIQPIVLSPFPESSLKAALAGKSNVIAVEENAYGQLRMLCSPAWNCRPPSHRKARRPSLLCRRTGCSAEGGALMPSKDLITGAQNTWCPGCGDLSIKILKKQNLRVIRQKRKEILAC